MLTPPQAKQFLADKYRERIELFDCTQKDKPLYRWKNKTDTCFCLVIETEWDYIARCVKEKMSDEQFLDFSDWLTRLSKQDRSKTFTRNERDVISADYITSATAMKEADVKFEE